MAWNNNGRHSIRGRFHQTLCAFAIKIPFNFIIKIQSNVHVLVCDRFCFPFTRSAWCLPGIWQSSKKQKQICWWNWPNDKVEVAYPNIDLCYYCPSNVNCNTFFWPSVLSISFEAITTFTNKTKITQNWLLEFSFLHTKWVFCQGWMLLVLTSTLVTIIIYLCLLNVTEKKNWLKKFEGLILSSWI